LIPAYRRLLARPAFSWLVPKMKRAISNSGVGHGQAAG
jgi:hypothetical protein